MWLSDPTTEDPSVGSSYTVASLAEALSASTGPNYDALVIDDALIGESPGLWQEVRGRLGKNLRIIRLLLADGSLTNAAIAGKLHTSEATVRRRRNRLEQEGYIRLVGSVNPIKLGFNSVAIIGVQAVANRITAVEQAGLKALNEGQRISFEVEPDKKGKGPKAVNLVLS